MSDLLGFASIALLILFTMCLALRWSDIKNILFVALIIRIITLLAGHYFVTLPDSTADAESFERIAWEMGQEGFIHALSQYNGFSSRFITWLIAIPYSLFGRSIMMAQSISLFFGISSIFLGCKIAYMIWDKNIAIKVGWILAVFPSLVLYSVLVMREIYVVFFITVALYGIVTWVKTYKLKSIILAIIGFIGATFFHGAMMIGAVCFIAIVGFVSFKNLFKSIKNFRVNKKFFLFFVVFTVSSLFYLTNKINVPYLGNFQSSTNLDNLLYRTQNATRGDAAWPEWTKINSPIEFIYKSPIRAAYVVFAPFPWDVKKTKHLIGMFDAFLYMYLTFLIFKNFKVIWKDPALRIILILLLSYIFVFGIGVGNFGTGIRHRSKFAVLFILLVAPFLKKFIFFKKIVRT